MSILDLIAGLYTSLGTHLFQSKIRLTQILTFLIQEYYDLHFFNHRIIGSNLQKFKMADKKTNGRLSLRLLKRAQEKQSESSSQLCTITISNVYAGRFQLWPNSIGINLCCGFELGVETEYML